MTGTLELDTIVRVPTAARNMLVEVLNALLPGRSMVRDEMRRRLGCPKYRTTSTGLLPGMPRFRHRFISAAP